MKINIDVHKVLEIIAKMKFKYLTLFIAFVSSFNLWFLSIYFFNHDFLLKNGLLISLLTTFALTISWCLITGISIPKYFAWYMLSMKIPIENDESGNKIIDLFVFAEIIILHSFFAYITYIFHLSFVIFLSVAFWLSFVQYFVIDWLAKNALQKFLEENNENPKED
jgi:hypothetical protein